MNWNTYIKTTFDTVQAVISCFNHTLLRRTDALEVDTTLSETFWRKILWFYQFSLKAINSYNVFRYTHLLRAAFCQFKRILSRFKGFACVEIKNIGCQDSISPKHVRWTKLKLIAFVFINFGSSRNVHYTMKSELAHWLLIHKQTKAFMESMEHTLVAFD